MATSLVDTGIRYNPQLLAHPEHVYICCSPSTARCGCVGGSSHHRPVLGGIPAVEGGAGRTVTLAGFLLGTVSGSGTATTVSLGSVTWPILRKAGYPKENAGGMLAAAGIGAILSPPTLGAAAFIIAEYLGVPYLTVLVWAIVPTILYYLGILLAVEIDARRYGTREVEVATESAWKLLGRFGYHLISLAMIVVFLAMDISAVRAVVYATFVQIALSFLDREHRLTPAKLYRALGTGVRGVLAVAAVCAAAGVIAAMITRTGLGLQLHSILVNTARGITENPALILIFTAVFAALAVAVLGLAVPVTASFVISWVVVGPALQDLGVAAPAAAMFVFYFAVLSEVTPPTALAAVAASAITGGRVMATMMADLEVHAARVPGAVRLRSDRQRRGTARAPVNRRHGLDCCGFRAGSGGAGGGHRRLADPAGGLAGTGAVRARPQRCCSICTRQRSSWGRACWRSRSW